MSFPRYEHYKETEVEWLGEVPEHWGVKRLKFLCDVQTGDKDTVNAVKDGLYPFFVRSQTVERINSFTFDCEAVLTAGDGVGVGKVFHYHNGPFDFHQRVYMLSNFRGVSGSFLFHYLKENFYKVALEGGAKSTVDSLRMPLFLNFLVTIPPIAEQKAIIQIMEQETAKIDTLIAEQQRLITLLVEKRQATISHAVTKGLNPDAPMKDSGIEWLGEVPKGWKVTRLANLFREVNESGNDELPVLSVSIHHGISDKELDDNERDRKVTRSEDSSKYKKVLPGDLVYNMMRAWQGGFGTTMVEGMVSPAYVVARPLEEMATSYIELLLRTPQAIEQMRRHSRGVTDFRLRLYWDEFKNIKVTMPPRTEANEICLHIAKNDENFSKIIKANKESITLLQERRTALVSAAVTGKIDVRGYASSSPMEAA